MELRTSMKCFTNSPYSTQHNYLGLFDYQESFKTHGSESRDQGGSSKLRLNVLETHTREYFTGTIALKIDDYVTLSHLRSKESNKSCD